ncbi:hypothetical protein BT69DRAFT_1316720 [Atractiella rhizophila]|nr:hypothetical protein BT69DRAFT_1316720 [Atractiella rhizophila]
MPSNLVDQNITLYTNVLCPSAHRARLALGEVGAKWEAVEIDLFNKPSWYKEKINPNGLVPVIQFGERDEARKVPESGVIVELIDSLFKESRPLLPSDPLERAQMRYYAQRFDDVLKLPMLGFGKDSSVDNFLQGIEELQGYIAERPGKFFSGDELGYWHVLFLIFRSRVDIFPVQSDIMVAPFIARGFYFGEFGVQPMHDVFKRIESEEKYKVFQEYLKNLVEHPGFKKSWSQEANVENAKERFGFSAKR